MARSGHRLPRAPPPTAQPLLPPLSVGDVFGPAVCFGVWVGLGVYVGEPTGGNGVGVNSPTVSVGTGVGVGGTWLELRNTVTS